MLPFKTTPVFRHGKDTPWGGDMLGTVFHKNIPDDRTGESLEVSALPGLCSTDDAGRPLDALLREYGEAMRGTEVGEEFPLLLKLICARQTLSVQVHPDDGYSRAHEGGKLGKAEAWVILDAAPGAKIVYGVKAGVTREGLSEAIGRGKAVEELLRWVEVHPGDVFNIPAGMVHAIGEDILLYEIQQSSDVTYRFWDWGRVDAQGNPRQLHIQKGLDVTDVGLQPGPIVGQAQRATGGSRTRLIENHVFTLDRLEVTKQMPLEEMPQRFRLLTALCEGWLAFSGGAIGFKPGDTVFIPASSPRLKLECRGTLLLASPPAKNA